MRRPGFGVPAWSSRGWGRYASAVSTPTEHTPSDDDSFAAFPPSAFEPVPDPDAALRLTMIDPDLGAFSLEDLGESLRLRSVNGVSEVVPKRRATVMKREASVLHVDWRGERIKMDFGSVEAAFKAIQRMRTSQTVIESPYLVPEPQPAAEPVPPPPDPETSLPVTPPAAPTPEPPPTATAPAPEPEHHPFLSSRGHSLLRRMTNWLAAIVLLAIAVVGGIVLGQRLIGAPSPAVDTGPRAVTIKAATGTADQNLGRFVAVGAWSLDWTSEAPIRIVLVEDGAETTLVDGSGSGTVTWDDPGVYGIDVESQGAWTVRILEAPPG